MTTHRQHNDLRGARVRLHLTSVTKDFTTLHNRVLRNKFTSLAGKRVKLRGLERALLGHLLSFATDRATDPDWRLDVDWLVDDFTEARDTVYGSFRRLEDAGFLRRVQTHDPATGHFEWTWDVTDTPGVFEQVTASSGKPGTGAAPPVDNLYYRRSKPRSPFPGFPELAPFPGNPDMENPDSVTSYRETKDSYLPASSYVSDAQANDEEVEGAVPVFARTAPPRLVSVPATERTDDERGMAPTEKWLTFIASLINARECIGKLMPSRLAQETLAIRAQVAFEHRGWSIDQLRQLLLGGLESADNLAGVWAWRLHPEHLPIVPGQVLDPSMAGAGDSPGPGPSSERIAQIRSLAGVGRGPEWERRMGGGTG